jgi:hypothetical protein
MSGGSMLERYLCLRVSRKGAEKGKTQAAKAVSAFFASCDFLFFAPLREIFLLL